jgi:two-component system catabolic regulation response regulator CreB
MKPTVLLIEDEAAIADNILYILRSENFDTQWFNVGSAGLDFLQHNRVDLVILDVGLPDINGFELCKKIRQHCDVPLIFLTARDSEIDRVVGLEIGADDYVVKPFSPRELVARVKVILRRQQMNNIPTQDSDLAKAQSTQPMLNSVFSVDIEKNKISYRKQTLQLTTYQFGVLSLLLSQPERVFSREQLMDGVWPAHNESFDRAVDTTIKQLRAKLKAVNQREQPLVTHRGIGYSIFNQKCQ